MKETTCSMILPRNVSKGGVPLLFLECAPVITKKQWFQCYLSVLPYQKALRKGKHFKHQLPVVIRPLSSCLEPTLCISLAHRCSTSHCRCLIFHLYFPYKLVCKHIDNFLFTILNCPGHLIFGHWTWLLIIFSHCKNIIA